MTNGNALPTRADRLVAEQKLDRWLVKSTDGVFARLNRRVSIPISRQLIRFPKSRRIWSVSLHWASAFGAGVFFALGSYLNAPVLGAFLFLCSASLFSTAAMERWRG